MNQPVDGLRRRIGAMHQLWQHAAADMTLEQVNHHERPGVLPIAFSLVHFVRGEDETISDLDGTRPALWSTGGWAERVGMTAPYPGRGTPIDRAETLHLGDLDAWRAYQREVFAQTEAWLATLAPERLDDVVVPGPLPESSRGAFVTYVVGMEGPIRLEDALECFIYQHGIRHLGEMEHARALVGLHGMT